MVEHRRRLAAAVLGAGLAVLPVSDAGAAAVHPVTVVLYGPVCQPSPGLSLSRWTVLAQGAVGVTVGTGTTTRSLTMGIARGGRHFFAVQTWCRSTTGGEQLGRTASGCGFVSYTTTSRVTVPMTGLTTPARCLGT